MGLLGLSSRARAPVRADSPVADRVPRSSHSSSVKVAIGEGGKRWSNAGGAGGTGNGSGRRWGCSRSAALALAGVTLLAIGLLMLLGPNTHSARLDPRLVEALPPAPAACSADLRERIAWGVGTSAYQVEGAWDEGGKAPSIWDAWSHTPGKVQGGDSGDVACDHYHRWREDVQTMVSLGIKHYRLSIAWTRILPGGGRGSHANAAGVAFYARLLRELRAAGVTPVVTLYHWDLPQSLQDLYGGFLDPQFAEDYVFYADTLFRELGHLVRHWITFNEPMAICQLGYGIGAFAPGVQGGTAAQYKCGHHLLIAHAKAVALYRGKYQQQQKGRISMTVSGHWGRPLDEASEADAAASEAYAQFQIGWIADPLYFGDYPKLMRDTQKSLPRFTAEQKALVAGSVDFLALNVYTAHYVRAPPSGAPKAQLYEELLADAQGSPPGPPSDVFWLFDTPHAMRNVLAWASRRYGRPEVWVTESGVAAPGEGAALLPDALKDTYRLDYYRGYLDSLCAAVKEDAVNLSAYYAWSLLDNFEWVEGYRPRFGIVRVDRAPSERLRRHPKLSAYWLSHHFFARAPPDIACLEIKSCGGGRS